MERGSITKEAEIQQLYHWIAIGPLPSFQGPKRQVPNTTLTYLLEGCVRLLRR